METIIRTENLSVAYDGKPAITDINLNIPKGGITAIIGPSGCGKSTLLRCLNGLIIEEGNTEMGGKVFVDGAPIEELTAEVLRRKVGLVFQTPTPFPFSIYRNMTYALKYYGMRDKKQIDEIVENCLRMAGLYDEVSHELTKNALKLSGGQQQRLCTARALTVNPEVLLLDEPCSALDVKSTDIIENTLKELKKKYTIVIVTHNIAQAERLSDYAVFINEGRLVEQSETLFSSPKEPETRAFLSR